MTDIRKIISEIQRVRKPGEKPVVEKNKFLGMEMKASYASCEICGKISAPGVNQCPYCGRFVGLAGWASPHKECWDSSYGCCKICGAFIKERQAKNAGSSKTVFLGKQKVKLMEKANPLLENAIHSLINAIEFTGKKEERYRQAALIEMDEIYRQKQSGYRPYY